MNHVNWTLWLALSMAYSMLTYNPVYQTLLLCTVSTVAYSEKQPLKTYLKMGLIMSAAPLFINIFLVHIGGTVIYTVPRTINVGVYGIPTLFFAGPVTAEATLFAVIVTILLVNMVVAFQTFNKSTSPHTLLRLLPSSMPAAGLALSVALRFTPAVVRDHTSIRDAQVSRGVKMNSGPIHTRLYNQLAVVAPTVVTSLERGFNAAESMASRGYSGKWRPYRVDVWSRREYLALAALIAGFISLAYSCLSGVMYYWPYDSLALPPLSAVAVAPTAALTSPLFAKNESS